MRYSGMLGISEQTEIAPGVFEDVITEYPVLGTIKQRTEVLEGGDEILPRYSTTTSISVMARGVGIMDNSDLQYVTLAGKRWKVASDVSQYPNLVLYLREEYHGPTPVGA
jgi:hypothetical protein